MFDFRLKSLAVIILWSYPNWSPEFLFEINDHAIEFRFWSTLKIFETSLLVQFEQMKRNVSVGRSLDQNLDQNPAVMRHMTNFVLDSKLDSGVLSWFHHKRYFSTNMKVTVMTKRKGCI